MAVAVTWAGYRESIGNRAPLFTELTGRWAVGSALYPGCYLDLAPSVAIASVTYVDTDARVARYFARPEVARSELAAHPGQTENSAGGEPEMAFLGLDYREALPLPDRSFDLLISLYAGPVWQYCRRYLRPGGLLLANASHGDASVAGLDPDLEVVATVLHRGDHYRLDTEDLGRYLVPKEPAAADVDAIRQAGRGIAYTRPAFAYVFRLPAE